MSAGLEYVSASAAVPGRARLRRGRTWMLIVGDLFALTSAYVLSYLVSDQLGSLPPVSAPGWFLLVVAASAPFVWVAAFTAYHLYENDALRISVSSFDEVRDLFHAMLAGSLAYLILSQGVAFFFDWWIYTAVEAALFLTVGLLFVPIVRGSIRSWMLPRVMTPRRTLVVGSGPEAQTRAAEDRGASRVRPRARRLPRRRRPRDAFADPRSARPGRGDRRPATRSTACSSHRRSGATRRRWTSCARCVARTCRCRSFRASSRSSRRTRRSTTSRACPSSRCRRCASGGARGCSSDRPT